MFGNKRYKAGQLVTLAHHTYRIKRGSLYPDGEGVCCNCFFFDCCKKGKIGPCGYKIGIQNYFVLVR